MQLDHGPRIGILGGGQLGGMMLRSAIDLGLAVSIVDADAAAPCSRYTGSFTQGSLLDAESVLAFGRTCEVVTIEIEAVNTAALQQLEDEGIAVYPRPATIRMIQDKWVQKQFLISNDIPVVPGILLESPQSWAAQNNYPSGCLKLCRGGYDGNGVMMMEDQSQWQHAFQQPSVLEELVDIDQEIASIVARNIAGQTEVYEPVAMIANPVLHLLDYQLCPAGISAQHLDAANNIATKIAEATQLVGILAVECFITKSGELLVNELAPRAHNSGHHTIEAAHTGQFEQLMRAVSGLPLGSAASVCASAMINIIAPAQEHAEQLERGLDAVLRLPGAHLHWYGKAANRPGRKLGHVTVTADTAEAAAAQAQHIRTLTRF